MTHDLDDLQKRIAELKADTQPTPPSESANGETANDKRDISAAYEMIMTPVICGGLGAGLDRLLSTTPTFFIILAILGVLAGFWRIYRVSQNIQTPLDLKRLQDAQKQGRKTQISDEEDD
jgi:F0F1-type ATP synthase assembly protein I